MTWSAISPTPTASFALACSPLSTKILLGVSCTQSGAWSLIESFILALVANQSAYLISPKLTCRPLGFRKSQGSFQFHEFSPASEILAIEPRFKSIIDQAAHQKYSYAYDRVLT